MVRLTVLIALVVLSTANCLADQLPRGFERIEASPAPMASFQDQNGKSENIGTFKGKVVILNLWATWCAPCVRELPSLNRLADRLDGNRAAVLAISQDKGGHAVTRPYLQKLSVPNLLAFTDPTGRLSREFGARGLPTTMIIDALGRVVARAEGEFAWDSDQIVAYLNTVYK